MESTKNKPDTVIKGKAIGFPAERVTLSKTLSKVISIVLLVLLTTITAYYLWTRGFIYFQYSREVYTDYFWGRAPWLLVHVTIGIVATLIGSLQFVPIIRRRYPLIHRNIGKLYFASVVVSTFVSFYLISATTFGGIVYTAGLGGLGVVWITTTFIAYLAIRRKNIPLHREWMIKSYVLTVSFVVFRSVEDVMAAYDIGTNTDRKVLMSWACWAVPFFITEVVLHLSKLYSVKRTQPQSF